MRYRLIDHLLAGLGSEFPHKLYHGTLADVQGNLKPSRGGGLGPGIYLTPDPERANFYAGNFNSFGDPLQGGTVFPVRARGNFIDGYDFIKEINDLSRSLPRSNDYFNDEEAARQLIPQLRAEGLTGAVDKYTGNTAIWNPEDVRFEHELLQQLMKGL